MLLQSTKGAVGLDLAGTSAVVEIVSLDAERALGTVRVGLTVTVSAVPTVDFGDAREVGIAVGVVAAASSYATVSRHANLAIVRTTTAASTDEVGTCLPLAVGLRVFIAGGGNVRVLAAEKAHHQAGGFEGRAHLQEIGETFAFGRAAVGVARAFVGAISSTDSVEALDLTGEFGRIDFGIAVDGRFADLPDLVGATGFAGDRVGVVVRATSERERQSQGQSSRVRAHVRMVARGSCHAPPRIGMGTM